MTIKSAEYVISSARVDQCPQGDLPEFAFIGRSNVGKSSLINMLTGKTSLAKTSATPGKTVLINHFIINGDWYLVDLPGYGYARRGMQQREHLQQMISCYILRRQQMLNLYLLIDSRHEPQRIDLDFIEWLGENGIPFCIVFTKADKLSRGKLSANIKLYLNKLSKQWEELPPYFITSSETRQGKEEVLGNIEDIIKSASAQ